MKKIKMLVLIFVMGMFIISCTVSNVPTNPPTDAAPETPIPATVTPTATPQLTSTPRPTHTPSPTNTATPLPDWIVNFTEPILKALADRSPTYEDDFSNPSSGWYNGSTTGHADVLIFGERGYDNGEYRITANGATKSEPVVCSGGEDRNVGSYGDFVAEFDVRFVSDPGENRQDWQLQFHRQDKGLYKITLSRVGTLGFGKCIPGLDRCPRLASTGEKPISISSADNWNHILLIVQGTKMAAYVNGIPTLYVDDTTAPSEFKKGYFSVISCNFSPTILETRWDNFRVWDISDLP